MSDNTKQDEPRCPRCGGNVHLEERYHPQKPVLDHLLVTCKNPKCRYRIQEPMI